MNLNIKTLSYFDKDVKKLFKKYKQLPSDLKVLKEELLENLVIISIYVNRRFK